MPTIEELFAEAEKDNKTFHPVDSRTGLVWFPGNLAAGLAVQTTHIWDDIVHLIKIRRPQRDEYRRKLLLKYIVIELRSLIEVMDRLQGEVMRAAVIEPSKERPWRGITLIESEAPLQGILRCEKERSAATSRNTAQHRCPSRESGLATNDETLGFDVGELDSSSY